MRKLLSKLWADDGGFIISVELLFICVILVIGLVAGLTALRSAVVTEMGSLGVAIMSLDPGFDIASIGSTGGESNGTGPIKHVNSTGGTTFNLSIGQDRSIFAGGNGPATDQLIQASSQFGVAITP